MVISAVVEFKVSKYTLLDAKSTWAVAVPFTDLIVIFLILIAFIPWYAITSVYISLITIFGLPDSS